TDDALAADPLVRREILDEVIAIADQTVLKLRNLSLLLRPPQLDSLGLEAALRGQVAMLARNTGLDIRLEVAPIDGRLPPAVELACFRIAQEALTNIARHAGASRAEVEVEFEDDAEDARLLLRVSDDGRGFDASLPGGLGLVTMRERATQLGGSVTITARPGGGTALRAVPPTPVAGWRRAVHMALPRIARKVEERAAQATTLLHGGVSSTSSAIEGGIAVQIVVVGGDADHVASVGRELLDHDPDWHLTHVATAADVPAGDSDRAPDVLVCASRVGTSSGLAVLAGLRPRHPGAVRILLLEPDAEHDLLDAFSTSHRILSEPLDSLALIDAIESVVELRE